MKKSRSKSKAAAASPAVSASIPASAAAEASPAVRAVGDPVKSAPRASGNGGANGAATVIEAKIDVGFGNHLYIRGGGAGLSWGAGTPLDCEDPETWIWRGADVGEPFEFKLLINDQSWCIGANYTVTPGAAMQVLPHFG